MRERETKSRIAARNMEWGMFNQLVTILMPFLLRTVIIYNLGVNYIGLRTLFSSILNVLNVAELGIGGVVGTLLYRPIVENNHKETAQLIIFLRHCYFLLGGIIFFVGLALLPFLDKFIAADYPKEINIYILYLINLLGTVISYFLFAYKKVLLSANQRYDIEVNITTVVLFIQTSLQVMCIIFTKNYYFFMLIVTICTVLNNLISNYLVNRLYPLKLVNVQRLSSYDRKKIYQKVQGAFYYRIGSVVLFSVDNIVISAFLGLSYLGIYNNYYYIMSSLQGIQAIVHNSIRPVIGQTICRKSIRENQREFFDYYYFYMAISTVCGAVILCLGQPFIGLWIGDNMQLSFEICMVLTINFMVQSLGHIFRIYQEAAGIFREGRYIPICGATVNLVLNLLLIDRLGLYGVVLSTIISVIIVLVPGYVFVIWKHYFKNKEFVICSFINIILYALGASLILAVTKYVCDKVIICTVIDLAVRGVICIIISTVLYIVVFAWKREARDVFNVRKKLWKHR